jgi:hypothetical protein
VYKKDEAMEFLEERAEELFEAKAVWEGDWLSSFKGSG